MEFGPGCRDCAVERSRFRDLGAGAVRIGGAEIDGPVADRSGHNRVEDCAITDYGRVFHQAVGVLLTNAFNCRIRHNHIARGCYSGISCGWVWGYRETISRDNLIENNLLRDIGQGVLSDMGAIYTLGVQPGTVILGNHIYRVRSASYGGWGIYPDEGSSHLLIENNWVHDTQGACLGIHFARELVVRHNLFARGGEAIVSLGRAEGHIAATLTHNLLVGPSRRSSRAATPAICADLSKVTPTSSSFPEVAFPAETFPHGVKTCPADSPSPTGAGPGSTASRASGLSFCASPPPPARCQKIRRRWRPAFAPTIDRRADRANHKHAVQRECLACRAFHFPRLWRP